MELQVVFFCALLAFFAGYVIFHVYILEGLRRLPFIPEPHQPQLSIIIAARNEEKGIASCINALLQQNYPKELFEIIVVNDRSEDRTAGIVAGLQPDNPNLHLKTITELIDDMPPKKNALRRGIEASRFDILVFTDADSIVPPGWLRGFAGAFSKDVGVVAGYSPFRLGTMGLSADFLRYEELKNSIGAAAAVGWQRPYMCTGRSFAYRKEVYRAVNGFESNKHSISGDDDLFIQRVERERRWKARYLPSPETAVLTEAPSTFREFVNQRTRHFSTGKYYPIRMKLMFGTIQLFNLLLILALFISPFCAAIFLLGKLWVDTLVMKAGERVFREHFGIGRVAVLEFLYVCYNLLIGPLGLVGNFTWKGTAKA